MFRTAWRCLVSHGVAHSVQCRGLGPGPPALRTGLHSWAVMDMRFLVAWDSPSTAEQQRSESLTIPGVEPGLSRPRRDVLTTRRYGHMLAGRCPGTVTHARKHIRGAIQPTRLCWLVIANQTARPPDQRRTSGHTRTSAASSVEHLMRGLPRGVLASMLPPPRRDRQCSAQSVPLRAQATTPSRC